MSEKFSLKRILGSKAGAITCVYAVVALVLCLLCLVKSRKMNEYEFNFSDCTISSQDEWTFETDYMVLNEGGYVFEVAYVSGVDALAYVRADNDTFVEISMPASPEGNVASAGFTLKFPSDCGKVRISAPSEISLVSAKLKADHRIYTDYYFAILFLILLGPVVYAVSRKVWANVDGDIENGTGCQFSHAGISEGAYELLGVCAIIVVACASIWIAGKIPMAGDVRCHLQRIQGIYTGLKSGQFPVVIYPNQINCFGQIGILYPNVLLYIPALLRCGGMSLFSAYKVCDSLVAVLTVLVAYHVSKKFFSDYRFVLLTTLLYSLGNSRFRVQLWGCSGGYGVAMIFIPLIVYGLYSVFYEKDKRWEYLAFGLAGVVSAHVITTVIIVTVVLLFALMHIDSVFKKDIFTALLKSVGTFFMMTLMIIVPFVRYYSLGINRENLSWSSFIGSLWSPLSLIMPENQMTEVVLVVLVIVMSIVMKKWLDSFYLKAFVLYVICTWFETTVFPWRFIDSIVPVDELLSSIQQADRIRYSTMFFIIVVFVYVLQEACVKKNALTARISLVAAALCIISTVGLYYAKQYKFAREDASVNDFVTGSIETKMYEDYLPSDTIPEDYASGVGNVSDESIVSSYSYEKLGTDIYYAYSATNDGEYAEFPLLYYEGYKAHIVDNIDEVKSGGKAALGEELSIVNGDRNHVRVYLPKTDAETMIKVHFKVNPIYLICVIISFVSIIVLLYVRIVKYKP